MNLEELSKKSFLPEETVVEELVKSADFLQEKSDRIFKKAENYVKNIREKSDELNIESFLKEYSLSSYEGVAVLCLAEALLRVPDNRTADELIVDKLEKGNWKSHIDDEASFMINSSTYGLMLGEEVLSAGNKKSILSKTVGKIISRVGEPVIRTAIKHAMRILGSRFVLGTNIEAALKQAEKIGKKGYLFSYDMLGEGARTKEQAKEFFNAYMKGAKEIGKAGKEESFSYGLPNMSIKLSALHPRFELKKKDRILSELMPNLKNIILEAKDNNVWVSIDAEESYRLELSLIVFEELLKDKDFENWEGLGFVVQAYNQRAKDVLEYLKELSEKYNRKVPVRLVKGAYWDFEIKYAQENGLDAYPVFTKKSHTDLSYLICSKLLLDNLDNFYPQFATHNALTVASLLEIAPENKDNYEFQRLFGMGDSFYDQLVGKIPCRIYAPVGNYEELLPYLIRRILENGANTSFVNLVVDKKEPIGEILTSPLDKIINKAYRSKDVPLPKDLYEPDRKNSKGYDFGNMQHLDKLKSYLDKAGDISVEPQSIIIGKTVEDSIKAAKDAYKEWAVLDVTKRIKIANDFAESLEENAGEIISILADEGKKTAKDAIFEIREAVDFIRFYSSEVEKLFSEINEKQKGYTGESSTLLYRPKGVFACISPWNFPLSIFIGQIIAALVTGNTVIAKPAEQTSKIACYATQLAHKAGFPKNVLQLILGKGSEIGKVITESNDITGVVFTGSTEVANIINRNLAARKNAPIATLIAETGGQNCFMVDSTALLERATDDIIESAFGSAGQKCSAARVAFVQEDIFDKFSHMLKGALDEIKIGKATDIDVDISAVIDEQAKKELEEHIKDFSSKYKVIAKANTRTGDSYVSPHIFEIDDISALKKENFGPVLHLIKFKRSEVNKAIDQINSTGYGLTFGIHSRIYNFINYVTAKINAGNIYVNRTCTGAVVETHPFGGMGLSGTGPKAGGPNYLKRFLHEVTITDNTSAIGGNLELLI